MRTLELYRSQIFLKRVRVSAGWCFAPAAAPQ